MSKHLLVMVIPLVVACSSRGPSGEVDHTEGLVSVGGRGVGVLSCKAVIGDHGKSMMRLKLDDADSIEGGLILIEDPVRGLLATRRDAPPVALTCTEHGGSIVSGVSANRPWVEGELKVTCQSPDDGEIKVDLRYDCGSTSRPTNRSARPKKP